MAKETGKNINISITPQTVIWTVVILTIFYGLYLLKDLVLVILMSVLIASAISPIARWFQAYRIPRIPAVVIIYAGFLIFLAAAFYFLLIPLVSETHSFVRELPNYLEQLEGWTPEAFFIDIPLFQDITGGLTVQEIISQINEALAGFAQGFLGMLLVIFGGVLNVVLIIVLSFYLAVQENGVGKFLNMITPMKFRNYIADLWRRAEVKMGLWLQGQVILAVIVAVLVYLGLTLLGIPHALLLAALAGIFELIPIFGPILAAIPAIIIAFVEGGNIMDLGPGLASALVVTGLYIVIQQFESQLIYPLVVRKVIGLSPIVVIIAIIAGFQLAGFLGLILSVPIAAILLEFMKDMQVGKRMRTISQETKSSNA